MRDVGEVGAARVFQPADVQRQQLRLADFRDHQNQLVLHELVRGDGLVLKLLARLGIFERGLVAGHGRADRAPADAVARLGQAAERPAQALDAGQHIFRGNFAIGHRQARSYRGAQRQFAMDVPGLESLAFPFRPESREFYRLRTLAQTTATSAIEPLVIHIFSPLRTYTDRRGAPRASACRRDSSRIAAR